MTPWDAKRTRRRRSGREPRPALLQAQRGLALTAPGRPTLDGEPAHARTGAAVSGRSVFLTICSASVGTRWTRMLGRHSTTSAARSSSWSLHLIDAVLHNAGHVTRSMTAKSNEKNIHLVTGRGECRCINVQAAGSWRFETIRLLRRNRLLEHVALGRLDVLGKTYVRVGRQVVNLADCNANSGRLARRRAATAAGTLVAPAAHKDFSSSQILPRCS